MIPAIFQNHLSLFPLLKRYQNISAGGKTSYFTLEYRIQVLHKKITYMMQKKSMRLAAIADIRSNVYDAIDGSCSLPEKQ